MYYILLTLQSHVDVEATTFYILSNLFLLTIKNNLVHYHQSCAKALQLSRKWNEWILCFIMTYTWTPLTQLHYFPISVFGEARKPLIKIMKENILLIKRFVLHSFTRKLPSTLLSCSVSHSNLSQKCRILSSVNNHIFGADFLQRSFEFTCRWFNTEIASMTILLLFYTGITQACCSVIKCFSPEFNDSLQKLNFTHI